MKTIKRLPRLARIVKSYLSLFDPALIGTVDFMERSRLKGRRLEQMKKEVARIESRRAGATLTEVLIAILIFSIGIIALAVLFPISVMRSIKAAQLTSATDARYNAEAAMDIFPKLIHDPANLSPGMTTTPAAYWGTNFIVDPLGFAEANLSGANANYFGNDTTLPAPPAAGSWVWLKRYGGTWGSSEANADYLVTMPDSWTLEYQGLGSNAIQQPNAPAGTGVTRLDVAGLNLGAYGTNAAFPSPQFSVPNPQIRAVIFSADGRSSCARVLTGAKLNGATTTIIWSEDPNDAGPGAQITGSNPPIYAATAANADVNQNGILDYNALPASFVSKGIGNVRIEYQERRYSWLLTVRMDEQGMQPSVDVVVFFKRRFDPATDEQLYQANFYTNSNQVKVTFTAGSAPPFMKKGSYIFDANNAFWYRISNVVPQSATTAIVILEGQAIANNSTIVDPNNQPNYLPPRAMFPRNVVDVYPIGTKGPN